MFIVTYTPLPPTPHLLPLLVDCLLPLDCKRCGFYIALRPCIIRCYRHCIALCIATASAASAAVLQEASIHRSPHHALKYLLWFAVLVTNKKPVPPDQMPLTSFLKGAIAASCSGFTPLFAPSSASSNFSILGATASHHGGGIERCLGARSRFTIGHEHKAHVPKHPLN